jgi:hypothetical protein
MTCSHVAQLREIIVNLQAQNDSLLVITALFQRLEEKVLRLELLMLPDPRAEEGARRGRN